MSNPNRIKSAFANQKAFIGFLTAGDPDISNTAEFILAMEEGGADLIEVGIPFSDPVAEGPVIEAANIRALEKKVSVDDVFGVIRTVRQKSDIPLVILSYLNPVYFYGYDKFFAECKAVGVDGIIIPDLPYEECREVTDVADKYGIELISLVTPTSQNRIEMIAKESKGFIYVVSSLGVTGIRDEIDNNIKPTIDAIKRVTDTPAAVGFGINRADQAAELVQYADGVIIGSAIVALIEEHGANASDYIRNYVKSIKVAL
ncbi:MAG: tryptophan synthase subunit alpha [Oscillospiraceae bacterium]|nr:tryptophan synthase subunit alpha [Oscillospiraceae bacterium]